MLDPVKLRVLRSVVETGSIRASAEALGYTPSAVSQHLSALRRETGLDLIERTGRGITVTAHGRILAAEAGTALDALAALERTATDLRSGRTGTLRLGYATSIASTWIPELARDLRRRYPDLGLELVLRDCSCEDLAADGMDIIVGEGTSDAALEDWAVQDFLEEGYVALVAREHPFADRASLPLKDLADQSWVTDDPLDSFWFDRIGAACRAAGFSPCVDVNPDDFATVLGFVATGDHISVQPSVIAQDLRPDIVAIPLDPPAPRRRLRVQVRRTVERNPAAQYIVQRLHAAADRRAQEIPGVVHLGAVAGGSARHPAADPAESAPSSRPAVPAAHLPGVIAL